MKRGSLKKWQFSRVLQLHSSSHSNQRRWWFSEIALFLYCENVKKRSYSIEKPVENNPLMTRILGWGSQWNTCSQRIGIFYGHDMRLPFQMQRLNESKPETVQSLRSHTSKDINPNVCLSNTRGGLMWKPTIIPKTTTHCFYKTNNESILFSGSEMSLMKIEMGQFLMHLPHPYPYETFALYEHTMYWAWQKHGVESICTRFIGCIIVCSYLIPHRENVGQQQQVNTLWWLFSAAIM